MGVVLRYRVSGESYRTKGAHVGSIDCETEPVQTVQAEGLAGGFHDQYWLEETGVFHVKPSTAKPPYQRPTMAQIARKRRNGLTVVSTFSGAGGSCLGFRMAGFRTVWASEFVDAARETYEANFPGVPVDHRSIRQVTGDQIREATGLDEFDVLEGSPPCASFSLSGKRQEGWGDVRKYSDTQQQVDDLFFEFARLVGELRPRAFVAENVKGLVTGKAKGYYLRIVAALEAHGYRVDARVLDAQWLGVPQRRQRVIIVGLREDVVGEFEWPKPLAYRYSIRDALPGLAGIGQETGYKRGHGTSVPSSEPSPALMAGGMGGVSVANYGAIRAIEDDTITAIEHVSGRHQGDEHPADEPSPTIQAHGLGANGIGNVAVRVEGGGHRMSRDITDEPVTTIHGDARDHPTAKDRVPHVVVVHDTRRGRPRDVTDEPAPTVMAGGDVSHDGASHDLKIETRYDDRDPSNGNGIEDYAIGREALTLRPGEVSSKYQNLILADENEPSPTVTGSGGGAGTASVVHPSARRKFTIDELRALCGFPVDFVLTGSYRQQWERLGRAVPPPMMAAVARQLGKLLQESPRKV